jgi:hypothetical protein
MQVLRIKTSNDYWLTSFLRQFENTTDYDLSCLIQKLEEKNEQLYRHNLQQSEIVIIKLQSENIFIILIDFTVVPKEEWNQLSPSLQKEISRALTEEKKYICFRCQVKEKHPFYIEIHKLVNTGTKLESNLEQLYPQIFFPFDTSSPPQIQQIFFDGFVPNEVSPDMRFTI